MKSCFFAALLVTFGLSGCHIGKDDSLVRQEIAETLFNKGVALEKKGEIDAAIAVYEELLRNFDEDNHYITASFVAKARWNMCEQRSNLELCKWHSRQIEVADAMPHAFEQAPPGSLEYFNQPAYFLADTRDLDLQQIIWPGQRSRFGNQGRLKRPDGMEVIIHQNGDSFGPNSTIITRETTYTEELARPDSPFKYHNTYDKNGILTSKAIGFYREALYGEYECKDKKCVLTKSYHPHITRPTVPMEKTRAAFLKQTGIDLYDTSAIESAKPINIDDTRLQEYFILTNDSHGNVIDGETGETLFRASRIKNNTQEAYLTENDSYGKIQKFIKKYMNRGDKISSILRKTNTNDKTRFYEVTVSRPETRNALPFTVFLVDIKKERVLYREEGSSPPSWQWPMIFPRLRDDVDVLVEYVKYIKMIKAEKDE